MKKIRKAVLPVAGLGTRMLPATKAIPKEMLPIVDKPLIQFVVNEAVAAGIKEIVLVTHASKNTIENHFDTSFELEAQLELRVKRSLLEEIRTIIAPGVTIISVRQAQSKGLGHAILCARSVVGDDEPFAVLLPDVIVDNATSNAQQDNLAAMLRRFDSTGASQILVEPVADNDVDKFGIVDCGDHKFEIDKHVPITKIVEKPVVGEAPSNMAVVGRYVFSPSIWSLLEKTQPGVGGEIQLTDAIAALMEKEIVEALVLKGKKHDCGNKLGYVEAIFDYALRHPELGDAFKQYALAALRNQ